MQMEEFRSTTVGCLALFRHVNKWKDISELRQQQVRGPHPEIKTASVDFYNKH